MTASEKITALRERTLGGGHPLSALTAYDYPTARLLDEAGIDLLLVGDSLGMVVLGFPDTTHVTMDHMLHHVAAAARGCRKALLVGDLPIHSYPDPATAVDNARRLVEAGAEAVKLEGGLRQVEKVRAITAAGIPFIGHLGMLPQRVKEEGGYKKKGKTEEQVQELIAGAKALQEAGASGLVLESVVPEAARQISQSLRIPTIGIGCGQGNTHGEVAVVTDLLGSYPWFVPPFATPRANHGESTRQAAMAFRQAITPLTTAD
ncbi:3-methyl-2-oxobutanoate hydroxymethyltransferase [Roseibacillus ishigakijimensis]|uniref:3-methyl-2-oxobutanoate hydroxymethyltransferase n=1 Tax=Roseibacillus ishigakijimensis TaxID=454146 RepID=A0A934RUU0_9BACT|nr:3-methyl-2-oxobutanoate hydroxymethyltransferase [Roseibacillus ishigakijimensis]MBK1835404.1 3-methyl-2-oxobutanoate hydroxymethyltransferase [Roseibacillus ishigakijimensis]